MKVFLRIFSVLVLSSLLVFAVSCNGSNKTPEQSGAVGGDGASASDAEVVAAIKEVLACKNALMPSDDSADTTTEYQAVSMSRSIPAEMNLTRIFQKLWNEDDNFRTRYMEGMNSFYLPEPNTEPVRIDTEYGPFVLDMDPPVALPKGFELSNFVIAIDDVLRIELPTGWNESDYDSESGIETSIEDYNMRYFDTRKCDGCFVEFHAVMTTKENRNDNTEKFSVEISDLKYKGTSREVTPYIQTEVEQFIKDGYVE